MNIYSAEHLQSNVLPKQEQRILVKDIFDSKITTKISMKPHKQGKSL